MELWMKKNIQVLLIKKKKIGMILKDNDNKYVIMW